MNDYELSEKSVGGRPAQYFTRRDSHGTILEEGFVPDGYLLVGGRMLRTSGKLDITPDKGTVHNQLLGVGQRTATDEQLKHRFFSAQAPCPDVEGWPALREAYLAELKTLGADCTACASSSLIAQYTAKLDVALDRQVLARNLPAKEQPAEFHVFAPNYDTAVVSAEDKARLKEMGADLDAGLAEARRLMEEATNKNNL